MAYSGQECHFMPVIDYAQYLYQRKIILSMFFLCHSTGAAQSPQRMCKHPACTDAGHTEPHAYFFIRHFVPVSTLKQKDLPDRQNLKRGHCEVPGIDILIVFYSLHCAVNVTQKFLVRHELHYLNNKKSR